MSILNRYLAKTLILTTLLAVTMILGMDFFIRLMGEFNDLGEGSYTLSQALLYVALSMPSELYNMFPMAGLLGCLLGLGTLASHSELVVMRASGVSIKQITRTVIVTVLFMIMVTTLISEFIAPKTLALAEMNKITAKSNGQAVSTQNGVWIKAQNSFLHINTVYSDGNIQDITRYQFNDNHELVQVSHADTARYKKKKWELTTVKESDISSEKVSTKTFEHQTWDLALNPTILRIAKVEPEEMTLLKLRSILKYQKANGLQSNSYGLAFWQRVFQPLTTSIMMLLAIPFIFGPLRSATMGLRLVAGVVLGFGFYILNQFFGPFSQVFQLPPIIAAIAPGLLFACIGVGMMARTS